MTSRCHQKKHRIPVLYIQGVAHWPRLLAMNCKPVLIFAPFSAAWVLLTPSLVAVNSLVKITLSDFDSNKSSTTFHDWVKPAICSIQPTWIPIRFVINDINPFKGKPSNRVGLQLDNAPYAGVILNSIRLTGTPRCLEKESV
ncbi:MAG: hypothetical protein M8364_11425 [Methylobacter sp.]|uniref:hypothetical protein n=1 Tax=Methylobacter sp. TaxID=2051955 RepID=UPI00258846DB|nr:hypothetical protein [Methylobacter sp.]MCL7421503.1 hypothetical protein [Methylobacter sp.]